MSIEEFSRRGRSIQTQRRPETAEDRRDAPARLDIPPHRSAAVRHKAPRGQATCLAGAERVDMPAATRDDHDEAASEVLDYMVHSGLLRRLSPDGG